MMLVYKMHVLHPLATKHALINAVPPCGATNGTCCTRLVCCIPACWVWMRSMPSDPRHFATKELPQPQLDAALGLLSTCTRCVWRLH